VVGHKGVSLHVGFFVLWWRCLRGDEVRIVPELARRRLLYVLSFVRDPCLSLNAVLSHIGPRWGVASMCLPSPVAL
jgi:hypothetical protein